MPSWVRNSNLIRCHNKALTFEPEYRSVASDNLDNKERLCYRGRVKAPFFK